jgi:carboxypeptidase C (cathepsin A)
VIYIDQPVGTGFSFGTDTINSTEAAAPPVWTAFQLLFESPQFAQYQSRECVSCHSISSNYTNKLLDSSLPQKVCTISASTDLAPNNIYLYIGYGGHYGPAFVEYFDEQNALIDAGHLQAEKVIVSALMINKSIPFSCARNIF